MAEFRQGAATLQAPRFLLARAILGNCNFCNHLTYLKKTTKGGLSASLWDSDKINYGQLKSLAQTTPIFNHSEFYSVSNLWTTLLVTILRALCKRVNPGMVC
jgi:hypothetical protein